MITHIKNHIKRYILSIIQEEYTKVNSNPTNSNPTNSRNIMLIKRSQTTDIPIQLDYGELAFSFKSRILFIGDENKHPYPIAYLPEDEMNFIKLKYEI